MQVSHQETVQGEGGEYSIDVLVTFTAFGEAKFAIFVECKHKKRPVEREDVLVVEGKLRDTGAHKGIIFSTSGFQDGAIKYAKAHGIATVIFVEGRTLFKTKGIGPPPEPPPWVHFPRWAGIRVEPFDGEITFHVLDSDTPDALKEWISAVGNDFS